ncbi:MAG: flagellar hook-basal body complex protein FliE [Limnobacter sp.]|nr:flagellar hook-basal body complex protein FliE [Limnobacter sp.]
MDLRISGAGVEPLGLQRSSGQGERPGAAPAAQAGGFARSLDAALESVSRLQNESTALQQQFQLGAENVSLERTMIAMQQSQVAFQAALTVRNRLVAAYTDIMNMPV